MKWWKFILVFFVFLILFGILFYFTKINNIFISKPNLENPGIDLEFIGENPGTQVVEEEHFEYLANELGSYKLHGYKGEPAVILFETIDTGNIFALIKNGEAEVTEEIPENYDLIVKGTQETIAEIILSRNIVESIKQKIEDNLIFVEIISDVDILIMKGFYSIYETWV